MKLRGHGDLLGYQQSGLKNFRFADPVHHKNLFELADNEIKNKYKNIDNFQNLLRLYDKAGLIIETEE